VLDVLISGGRLIDGTGNPATYGDVAIEGDRIVGVGRLDGAEAQRTIDARGKVVCPGFVDPDGHSDYTLFANPTQESTIRQGVTTEVFGGCGNSFAPVSDLSRSFIAGRMRELAYDGPVEWSSMAEYMEAIEAMGTTCNFACLAGHNAIRYAAGVSGPDPSEQQLRTMEDYVREAMEAGAVGMSSGLEFEPGRSSSTAELIRLARVAGEFGGYYVSHTRNRDARLQEAVDEFVAIVREATGRGHHLHLNVRHNTGAPEGGWRRAVETLEAANDEGLSVLTDAYPFRYALGLMAGVLPPWLFADGVEGALRGLQDGPTRERLKADVDRYWRFLAGGDMHRARPQWSNETFADTAARTGQDPWDCYFDVLVEAGTRLESVTMVGELFTDEHLAEMASHPLFCLSPDNWASTVDTPLAQVTQHPLPYCGYIHFLTHHVRETGTLRLEEAIRKMTSMPAHHFGLRDRGLLAKGCLADVVVFDWQELDDVSTWEEPVAYARGVEHVLVNGVLAIDGGERTAARPGRILRRS
jgi:N-acyl-D-amino-acid deacylase